MRKKMTTKEKIINKAFKAVGERNDHYGTPLENFERIAKLWSCHLERNVSIYDVGVMLMLLKIARSKHDKLHEDTWIDIAGYAGATAEATFLDEEIKQEMKEWAKGD
tara:strand:+ start:424 stop:744 length:321 start_codon:yes stop_codon:yes gene_type:complete